MNNNIFFINTNNNIVETFHSIGTAKFKVGGLGLLNTKKPNTGSGYCTSDPNNPSYYIAKTTNTAGWKHGDKCFKQGGGTTGYGQKPCIGGSGSSGCVAACNQNKISCKLNTGSGYCTSDPNNPSYYIAKTTNTAGWKHGDKCFKQGGGTTGYGQKPCIGGSGSSGCVAACNQNKISCKPQGEKETRGGGINIGNKETRVIDPKEKEVAEKLEKDNAAKAKAEQIVKANKEATEKLEKAEVNEEQITKAKKEATEKIEKAKEEQIAKAKEEQIAKAKEEQIAKAKEEQIAKTKKDNLIYYIIGICIFISISIIIFYFYKNDYL